MITIACTHCGHALRVTGDLDEVRMLVGSDSEYWPDKYLCFNCNEPCSGFISPEVSPSALQQMVVVDVTPQEAFAALNGIGVPAERTVCEEVVVPLFEAQGIRVRGSQVRGAARYHIDSLIFPDGTTLHIGSAPAGPVVYRITKLHSYTNSELKIG